MTIDCLPPQAREHAAAVLSTLARGQFANKRAILKATGLPPLIKLLTDDRLQSQQYVIASLIASDYPPSSSSSPTIASSPSSTPRALCGEWHASAHHGPPRPSLPTGTPRARCGDWRRARSSTAHVRWWRST